MKTVLTAVAALAFATAAAAQNVPNINYEASCRAARNASAGLAQTMEACRNSELAARDALREQWNNFAATDRASCHRLTTTGTPGTYTELLTCLEMKRDARKLPYDRGTIGLGGPTRR
jgi:hypothetical protein